MFVCRSTCLFVQERSSFLFSETHAPRVGAPGCGVGSTGIGCFRDDQATRKAGASFVAFIRRRGLFGVDLRTAARFAAFWLAVRCNQPRSTRNAHALPFLFPSTTSRPPTLHHKQTYRQVGAIPESALSSIAYQMLLALAYLKQVKRVHRDIKPSNLLINSQGIVKVLCTVCTSITTSYLLRPSTCSGL